MFFPCYQGKCKHLSRYLSSMCLFPFLALVSLIFYLSKLSLNFPPPFNSNAATSSLQHNKNVSINHRTLFFPQNSNFLSTVNQFHRLVTYKFTCLSVCQYRLNSCAAYWSPVFSGENYVFGLNHLYVTYFTLSLVTKIFQNLVYRLHGVKF